MPVVLTAWRDCIKSILRLAVSAPERPIMRSRTNEAAKIECSHCLAVSGPTPPWTLTLVGNQKRPYLGVMPGCRVAMYGVLETRLLHICWDFGWSWG